MKNLFIKQLFVLCLLAKTVQCADLPEIFATAGGIIQYLADPAIDKLVSTEEKRPVYKANVHSLTDFLTKGSHVAQNALDFKNDLPNIKPKANLLAARIKCLDKSGSAQCSAIGCTSEEVCIAQMLQALVELLEPLIKDFIGKPKSDDPSKIEPGALLSLVNMLPDKYANKAAYQQSLLDYIGDANLTIEFIKSLNYMLNPATLPAPTDVASKLLVASVKSEPIEIAEDADLKEFE